MYKNKKKKKINPLLTAAAGVLAMGAYNYIKGNGVFNKTRFKNEHEALSRYIDAHYPKAFYSPIISVPDGWTSVIRTLDGKQIAVFISKFDNSYIFKESVL